MLHKYFKLKKLKLKFTVEILKLLKNHYKYWVMFTVNFD